MNAIAKPIIAALDTTDRTTAEGWARQLAPHCGMLKLGLAYYLAHGAEGYRALRQAANEADIFLDLKLHDIPNTVAGGVEAVLALEPALLTIHASGGRAMIAAARRAAETAGPARPKILAVTVLTSLSAEALTETGVPARPADQVMRLARLAVDAGADGLVCSPQEVAMLRRALGEGPLLVVPGIRPEGSPADDQARSLTPVEAIEAGADYLVIGRPLTRAADPAEAARAVQVSLEPALAARRATSG